MCTAASVGNLLLRSGFALSIVLVAVGMTAAASDTVARCDARAMAASARDGALACAPAPAAALAVSGFEAAPNVGERRTVAGTNGLATPATLLVALATGLVFLAIFAILLGYRQRPGGVRAPTR